MNRVLLDPKIPEVKLYLTCYKVMQGDPAGASNINRLLKESTLFNDKEMEKVKKGITKRVKVIMTN